MREKKYLTVLDPLQEKFGDVMTGILLLGELFAELMWGASILIALGKKHFKVLHQYNISSFGKPLSEDMSWRPGSPITCITS